MSERSEEIHKLCQEIANLKDEIAKLKAERDDNYEQGFTFGTRSRLKIDEEWQYYRGSLSYGEFRDEWFKRNKP